MDGSRMQKCAFGPYVRMLLVLTSFQLRDARCNPLLICEILLKGIKTNMAAANMAADEHALI